MPIRFIPRRRAWFDFWLLGRRSKFMPNMDASKSLVEVFFEVENSFSALNPPFITSDFPLPETQWTRYYLREENALSTSPAEISATDSYEVVSGTTDDQADGLEYRIAFENPTAICGPIVATLWASCTTKDTDFFVVLSDIAPDGRTRALQRGMLRASLRAIDKQMSRWMSVDGEQVLVRPYHVLDSSQRLEPGKPYRFEIEVFPVGHVFREGHQLSLSIGPPPVSDPVPYPSGRPKLGRKVRIESGSYKYESSPPKGTVTIHRSQEHPSSVLLPLLPDVPSLSAEIPASIDQMWTRASH
jgi:predicted acyl esterase